MSSKKTPSRQKFVIPVSAKNKGFSTRHPLKYPKNRPKTDKHGLGSKSSFSVNMNKIASANKVNAFWIDPKTGDSVPIGSFPNTGVESFSTPAEWEDAILMLETSDSSIPASKGL